jgi:hypothetical protein
MVTKQLSIAIAVAISFGIGLGLARPDLKTLAAAPISATPIPAARIDFDRVFADVTRQGDGYIDRANKRDRLPIVKSVSPEPAPLSYCEPVASPYSDPVLSRIIGRCAA